MKEIEPPKLLVYKREQPYGQTVHLITHKIHGTYRAHCGEKFHEDELEADPRVRWVSTDEFPARSDQCGICKKHEDFFDRCYNQVAS